MLRRPQNFREWAALRRYLARDRSAEWRQIQADFALSLIKTRLQALQRSRDAAQSANRCEPIGGEQPTPTASAFAVIPTHTLPQRHVVSLDDRYSEAYKSAVHEAGHVLELLLHYAGDQIEWACVTADDGGLVKYSDAGLDRTAKILILVGGHAALVAYGFRPTGQQGDFDYLRALGLEPVERLPNGDLEETHELAGFRMVVQRDVRRHQAFVDALADELFLARPARVDRSRILQLWESHGGRWP
jgi:hypothetical protein